MESQRAHTHLRRLARSRQAGASSEGGVVHIHSPNSNTALACCAKASTEHQLQTSKSNYEILASGRPLTNTYSLAPALRASIGEKRARHQREEKMRRDRMKHALELLAAVLPPSMPSSPAGSKSQPKNSNRAETIENAIEYINMLHAKLDNGVKPRDSCGCIAD